MTQSVPAPAGWVILDRDGVINEDSDAFIKSPEEWVPIPRSLEAIARLTQAGYRIAVVTNQSGVGRSLFDHQTLQRIHGKMKHMIEDAGGEIAALYVCPHGPDEGCTCRKPEPGLLYQFAREQGVSLTAIPCIGDSLRDIAAARRVGARPLLVKTGKGLNTLAQHPELDVLVFDDLYEAAESILSGQ